MWKTKKKTVPCPLCIFIHTHLENVSREREFEVSFVVRIIVKHTRVRNLVLL